MIILKDCQVRISVILLIHDGNCFAYFWSLLLFSIIFILILLNL